MRNPTLHKKVEAFVRASLIILKKFSSQESVPKIKIDPYSVQEVIDSYAFVFKHFKEINKLPEFVDCAKYLRENPTTLHAINRGWKDINGNIIPEEELRKKLPLEIDLFRDLHHILSACIQKNNAFVFSKEQFEKIYEKFEKSIYSKLVSYRVYSILEGFSGDFDDVILENHFKIRKMNKYEKRENLNNLEFHNPLAILGNISHEYILETDVKLQKNKSSITISAQNTFSDIISTLRLFKSGKLTIRTINSEPVSWTTFSGKSTSWLGSRSDTFIPNTYALKKSEINSFLTIWRLFKRFRKNVAAFNDVNFFNIALKRFNYGIEENDLESKIIDFLISFEALYLTESDELSYRLSNRVAILLAKNSNEAEEIRLFMKKAYDVRSKLVHGKKNKPLKINGQLVDLKTISKRLEDYLRSSLKIFVKLSIHFNEQSKIVSLLDKSLFDGKAKKLLFSKR